MDFLFFFCISLIKLQEGLSRTKLIKVSPFSLECISSLDKTSVKGIERSSDSICIISPTLVTDLQ